MPDEPQIPIGKAPEPPPPPPFPPPTLEESSEDYSKYEVDQELDGIVIHDILLQYPDAIVFTSKRGGINFRVNPSVKRADTALAEFYRVTSKSTAQLGKAYATQVNYLLGAALAEALNLPEIADLKAPFKTVDDFIDAHGPILVICGSGDGWNVFIDRDGRVVCDYPEVSETAAPLLLEFYRLRELATASLRENECRALAHILGTELSIALQRTTSVTVADAFTASTDFIQLRNESRMRVRYLSSAVIAAIVFGILARLLLAVDAELMLGCIGGIVGATVSVLQRSANLVIRRFLPTINVVMQGAVRIALGILFGLLIVAAMRAKLALSSFPDDVNMFFLAGVAAGLSERFIPDLLTKIASTKEAPARQ